MNLGRMYLAGRGVKSDPVEAYRWFYVASENGGGVARHYMLELEGTANFGDVAVPLTPEQIQEAIRRAKEFQKCLKKGGT
jgi:TPR repeat protein